MIFPLLLSLMVGPASKSEQAMLRSCEMSSQGWICVYRIPPITMVPEPGSAIPLQAPEMGMSAAAPAPVDQAEIDSHRLMLRCAEASWLSLCTPGDRRQARLLRDAANARAALRENVTRLLSEDRCDEAVRTALRGGNMELATEARAFCQTPAPAPPTASPKTGAD